MNMPSAKQLRRELRKAMPPESFEPQPLRGVVALGIFAFSLCCASLIVVTDLPWFVNLMTAVLIGECMASVLLCAHESMHGAVFKSRIPRSLLAWAGFAPLLLTPGLWRAWHNLAHHHGANQPEYDPDILATVEQYRNSLPSRVRALLSPGSGHWVSYVGFFILFTLEGHFFLWYASGQPPLRGHIPMKRSVLRLTSTLLIGCWLGLVVLLRPINALWVLFVPLAIANLILMSYVSTQHWLRPQMDEDDPFCSSASVTVPRWIDMLHFRFSYHQEHHIFPSMSPRFAPLLRQKLRQIEPAAIAVLPMKTALREVLRVPALYADKRSLSHPDGRGHVDLHQLAQRLELPTRLQNPDGRGGSEQGKAPV